MLVDRLHPPLVLRMPYHLQTQLLGGLVQSIEGLGRNISVHFYDIKAGFSVFAHDTFSCDRESLRPRCWVPRRKTQAP